MKPKDLNQPAIWLLITIAIGFTIALLFTGCTASKIGVETQDYGTNVIGNHYVYENYSSFKHKHLSYNEQDIPHFLIDSIRSVKLDSTIHTDRTMIMFYSDGSIIKIGENSIYFTKNPITIEFLGDPEPESLAYNDSAIFIAGYYTIGDNTEYDYGQYNNEDDTFISSITDGSEICVEVCQQKEDNTFSCLFKIYLITIVISVLLIFYTLKRRK